VKGGCRQLVTLKGIGGSRGYASGIAVVKREIPLEIPMRAISDVGVETARFAAARENYDKRLAALSEQTGRELGPQHAGIFEAYREILADDVFFGRVLDRVAKEKLNVECLISEECKNAAAMFEGLDSAYLRERGADVGNVCTELIRIMLGISHDISDEILRYEDVILVAGDLTTAETVKLDKKRLRGFVTARGGVSSHTVILAKALGIPAIVGAEGALEQISTGMPLLLDAIKGEIAVNPGLYYQERFYSLLQEQEERRVLYSRVAQGECRTLDGVKIDVGINSGDAESIRGFNPAACDGVGLLRTEFLFLGRGDYPGEETQYEAYRDMAVRAEGKEVVIRTLDIGGDKQASYMNLPHEENPFLGFRAIRLCLSRREIFLTQLRAVLRAAVYGNVKLMFPMIVTPEELLAARDALGEAVSQLEARGIPCRAGIPVGIMIETPAAALLADSLAAHCDFFSVGTNDLIQYVTAADRMNQRVQYLYDCCNISVLRAIRHTAAGAAAAGIPWGICGEAASEELLLPLWVAMGVKGLSVAPPQVGRVKYLIRRMDSRRLARRLEPVFEAGSIDEAKRMLAGALAAVDR
jgi:phosphotransferase system enzyme I (PtsI)